MSVQRNLLFNFLLSFSQIAFPLLSIPYVTRVLDPVGIGRVGFIDSLTYYFIVVAEFGIATYGIREVARKRDRPEELKTLVSELVSLHLLTSIASTTVYLGLLFFLYQKIGDIRLILFSLSFLLVNSFTCEWYFWGREKVAYITLRSLVTRVLGLASLFLLVKGPDDYAIYYGIIVGTAIANLVWNFYRMSAEIDIRLRNVQWRRHLSVITITYKISLVYSVVLLLDNIFLQLLSTSVAVAYYMFAAKIVRIASSLVTDTLLVLYPYTVHQVYKNEKENFQATVAWSVQMIVLATVPMAGGIFLLADQVTTVYFGRAFLPLATDLKILSLYPFLKSVSLFLNKQVLMPFDQEKLVLKGLFFGAIAFVGLTIPLSYFFADRGTSVAVVVSELVVLCANFYFVNRLNIKLTFLDWKTILHSLLGVVFFVPIIQLVYTTDISLVAQLIAAVLLCMVSYFLVLAALRNKVLLAMFQAAKSTIFP